MNDVAEQINSDFRSRPVAAMRWRRVGGAWLLIDVTASISDICGYPRDEFLSGARSWEGLIFSDDQSRRFDPDRLDPAATTATRRYRITGADGGMRQIFDQIQVWRRRDNTVREFSSVLIDVTEVSGAALKRHDVGLLAYVSHEVRTPLTGIIALAEALRSSPLSAEQREVVDTLSDAGAALMSLVNNVLDLSRLDTAGIALDPVDFRLGELCCSAARLFAHRATAKGLDLRIDGQAMDILLNGDAARLRQVVHNLLANAIKYTKRGGVTLSWSCQPPAGDGRIGLRISVADTGAGMNAETLERVFAPFETAPSGLLSDHAGAGLGLPISREIMSALRGKLWAESVPGRGSIFHLECRVKAAAPPETEETDRWREAAEAARKAFAACAPDILVADDTEANRHVVSLLLGPHVGSVSFAHDGGEAVAMTQSRRFDAIVMDSRMPVLDGVEATRRIRAAERRTGAPATPIVGLSADPPVAAEAAFRAAGADGFVAKPIHPDELIAALGEAMRAAREQTRRGEDDPAEFPLMREAMRA